MQAKYVELNRNPDQKKIYPHMTCATGEALSLPFPVIHRLSIRHRQCEVCVQRR